MTGRGGGVEVGKGRRDMIRGGQKKKKPGRRCPDYLCQHELRVTMVTRQ